MRLKTLAATGALLTLGVVGTPAGAEIDSAEPPGGSTGTIGTGVELPGSGGSPGSAGGSSGSGGSGDGEGGEPQQLTINGCPWEGFWVACPEPGEPTLPSAEQMAQMALDQVTIVVPEPQTSPSGAPQLAGKRTWYWIDPDDWQPVTARAELPGIWAEVTATPTTATWTPGDGSPDVVCDGPGRPHPGTSGATTDCGHPYTHVGTYTLTLTVTYAVTWTSSTGESGTQPALSLSTTSPITVEQRQVVVS